MHVLATWVRWMVFGLILLSAAEVAATGNAKVYRFVSARKLESNGRDHLIMLVQPPAGGQTLRLVLPNQERDRYSPKKQDADLVNGMQPGGFLQAKTEKVDGVITVDSIAGWSPRPGEDTPHGYIYMTSGGSEKNPGELHVSFMKFGEPIDVIVPAQAGDDGRAIADPQITADLKAIQPGDVVWADVLPGKTQTLLAIVPWSEPQHGRLMRVGPADVDGERRLAAEIATETKPVTALIPLTTQNGRRAADPRLLVQARQAGNGSEVLFRVREEGGQTWLLEIERPPKNPPPVAQRPSNQPPPAGIPVHSTGGAGSVPGVGGIPGGF